MRVTVAVALVLWLSHVGVWCNRGEDLVLVAVPLVFWCQQWLYCHLWSLEDTSSCMEWVSLKMPRFKRADNTDNTRLMVLGRHPYWEDRLTRNFEKRACGSKLVGPAAGLFSTFGESFSLYPGLVLLLANSLLFKFPKLKESWHNFPSRLSLGSFNSIQQIFIESNSPTLEIWRSQTLFLLPKFICCWGWRWNKTSVSNTHTLIHMHTHTHTLAPPP
jgi:hypothetical protein